MGGQVGGSGAQGVCYNEDGLPAEYRGNLFFCDWGLQTVFRFEIRKAGGTFAVDPAHGLRHQGGRGRLPPVLAGRRGRRRRPLAGRLGLQRLAGGRRANRPAVPPALHRPERHRTGPAPFRPGSRRPASRRSTTRRCRSGWSRSGSWREWDRRPCRALVAPLEARRARDRPAARALGARRDRRRRGAAGDRLGAGRPLGRVRLQAARSVGIRR